jgi:uncharacterized lipoprotein YddW (UPF0748 family)
MGEHRSRTLTIVSIAAAGLLAGCQKGNMFTGSVRAIWVIRDDYKTPEDVVQIMENCRKGGFNTVVFQVRGNATTYYPSKIEPWSEAFDYQSPGFDPLALACQEAHARGMELHAWVNVMPAWRGTKPPTHPEQVYNKHPEWFWYDQHGKRQALSTFYVSLNPCLPEVRRYIVDVFHEIVANYNVDGLHMDYIRFPSEPPAIPQGSGIDYPRDAKTLALYKQATGLMPDDNREAWNRWRTEQVTHLVADIRSMMRWTRPRAALSASVGAHYRESLRYFRDDKTWVKRGLLDAAFPMNYKPSLARFNDGLVEWQPLRKKITVVPGLWFDPNLKADEGTAVVRQQIQASVNATGNFCVFSYGSLFELPHRRAGRPGGREPTTQRAEENRARREARQRELLPVTKFGANAG